MNCIRKSQVKFTEKMWGFCDRQEYVSRFLSKLSYSIRYAHGRIMEFSYEEEEMPYLAGILRAGYGAKIDTVDGKLCIRLYNDFVDKFLMDGINDVLDPNGFSTCLNGFRHSHQPSMERSSVCTGVKSGSICLDLVDDLARNGSSIQFHKSVMEKWIHDYKTSDDTAIRKEAMISMLSATIGATRLDGDVITVFPEWSIAKISPIPYPGSLVKSISGHIGGYHYLMYDVIRHDVNYLSSIFKIPEISEELLDSIDNMLKDDDMISKVMTGAFTNSKYLPSKIGFQGNKEILKRVRTVLNEMVTHGGSMAASIMEKINEGSSHQVSCTKEPNGDTAAVFVYGYDAGTALLENMAGHVLNICGTAHKPASPRSILRHILTGIFCYRVWKVKEKFRNDARIVYMDWSRVVFDKKLPEKPAGWIGVGNPLARCIDNADVLKGDLQ
jgi:hypothetical protein